MAKKKKRIKKVMVVEAVADYSFDQMREFLQDELNEQGIAIVDPDGDQVNYPGMMPWVVDVYSDRLIYRAGSDLYSIPYTASDGADGPEAEFGDPVEVFVTYTPTGETSESLREAGRMFSAANTAKLQSSLDQIKNAHDQVMKAHGTMSKMLDQVDASESLREASKPLTASVGGEEHPAKDFAYTPNIHRPSTWKFPIHDKAHVNAASARMNQTDIPEKDLPGVKAKVRAAWKKVYPDKKPEEMPDAIKEAEGDESDGLLLMEAGLLQDKVAPLLEAAVRRDGTMPIKIISPGWGSSGYYSREMLEHAADQFPAGMQMFLNHATRAERAARPEGDVNKLAATLTENARFLEHAPAGYKAKDDGPGLYAEARIVDSKRKLVEDLAQHVGLSINGEATKIRYGEAEGRRGPIIEGIKKVDSVDIVTRAGRGGEVMQIMESYNGTEYPKIKREVENMNEEAQEELRKAQAENARLKEALILREAKDILTETLAGQEYTAVSELTKQRISESLASNPPMKGGDLDKDVLTGKIKEAVKAEVDYLAKLTGAGQVRGFGGSGMPMQESSKESQEAEEARSAELFRQMGLKESTAKLAAAGR